MADADQDIALARKEIASLDKKAATVAGEAKEKIDRQSTALRLDLRNAEDKLASLKRAGAARWKEFESDVTAAMARLKKSVDTAAG